MVEVVELPVIFTQVEMIEFKVEMHLSISQLSIFMVDYQVRQSVAFIVVVVLEGQQTVKVLAITVLRVVERI